MLLYVFFCKHDSLVSVESVMTLLTIYAKSNEKRVTFDLSAKVVHISLQSRFSRKRKVQLMTNFKCVILSRSHDKHGCIVNISCTFLSRIKG